MPCRRDAQHLRDGAAVRGDAALRAPGGARRVEDHEGVVFVDRLGRAPRRVGCEQRRERDRAGAAASVADVEDLFEGRHLRPTSGATRGQRRSSTTSKREPESLSPYSSSSVCPPAVERDADAARPTSRRTAANSQSGRLTARIATRSPLAQAVVARRARATPKHSRANSRVADAPLARRRCAVASPRARGRRDLLANRALAVLEVLHRAAADRLDDDLEGAARPVICATICS